MTTAMIGGFHKMQNTISNDSFVSDSDELDSDNITGHHTGNLDELTMSFATLNDDEDEDEDEEEDNMVDRLRNDGEFTADMKPLQFKMDKTAPHSKSKPLSHSSTQNTNQNLLHEVREHLQSDNLNNISTNHHIKNNPFNFIDTDQFENYLKEPKHIKLLKRTNNIKQFRRLFLAQELNTFDTEDAIHGESSVVPPLSKLDSNRLTNTESNNSASSSTTPSSTIDSNAKGIFSTKFSHDGKFMATGSKNGVIKIWKVISSPVERWELNSTLDSNLETKAKTIRLRNQFAKESPTTSPMVNQYIDKIDNSKDKSLDLYAPVFHPFPVKIFKEHKADILDLDWSKNGFLLSASMDKTVKLWHPERKASLKSFQHRDFVTSVKFHPLDDRFFITGCLDHKCRLWSIIDNEISYEFDCQDLITSVTFSPDESKYTIIGTFNGFVFLLLTNGFEPVSSFHVTDRHTQNPAAAALVYPNSYVKNHHGPRVTGIETFHFGAQKSLRAVITTNDSKIRVFDLREKKLLEVLRGHHNSKFAHKTQLHISGKHQVVMASSDNNWIYGWKLKSSLDPDDFKESKHCKLKRNLSRSGSLRTLFSKPLSSIERPNLGKTGFSSDSNLTSASAASSSKEKLSIGRRHSLKFPSLFSGSSSNSSYIKNSAYMAFHAHSSPVTTVTIAPLTTAKTLSLSNDSICELSLQYSNKDDILDFMRVNAKDENAFTFISKSSSRANRANSLLNDQNSNSNSANVVSAIGSIIVSTDTNGVIRVFRADLPTKIRNRVLDKLQEYKNEINRDIRSSISSSTFSSPRLTTSNSFTSISSLARGHSNSNPIHTRQSFTKSLFKSASSTNFNNLTNYHECVANVTSQSKPFGSAPVLKQAVKSPLMAATSTLGLSCDVCNGTRFEPIARKATARIEGGYYCLDCGTILNNFR